MTTSAPHFMLIFRETTPERYEAMTREQTRACLDVWNEWCAELVRQGRMHQGHPLAPEGRVISEQTPSRTIDGPFAEAKELIGGYFLITAADLEEASEIAAGCPNLAYGMSVEVRPIAPVCHLGRRLGLATMLAASES